MDVNTRSIGRVVILDMSGRISGRWAGTFRERLLDLHCAETDRVVINLREVTLVDWLGAAAIREAIDSGMQVRLACATPGVLDDLKRNGLVSFHSQDIHDAMAPFGHEPSIDVGPEEKRTHPRKSCSLPVKLAFVSGAAGGASCDAVATDISHGGLFIQYLDCKGREPKISVDEQLEIIIAADKLECKISSAAKIVHTKRGKYQLGLGVRLQSSLSADYIAKVTETGKSSGEQPDS